MMKLLRTWITSYRCFTWFWDSIINSVRKPLRGWPSVGVGKWGQGAWTHHPLYSRKPRPHGRRQPCICRPQLGSFPTPALGQYTPPVWPSTGQLWLSTTSDQHWGSLAPPLPSGRSSTLSQANHSLCSFQKGREPKSRLTCVAVLSFALPTCPHCVKTSTDSNFILVHF